MLQIYTHNLASVPGYAVSEMDCLFVCLFESNASEGKSKKQVGGKAKHKDVMVLVASSLPPPTLPLSPPQWCKQDK